MSKTKLPNQNKRIRVHVSTEDARKIVNDFISKGFKAELKNVKNYHIVVTGEKRIVNYYPTTGTVQCNPAEGFKPFKLIGAKHDMAILRVADLARYGY